MEEAAVAREGKGGGSVRELPHPLFPLPLQLLPSAAPTSSLSQESLVSAVHIDGVPRIRAEERGRG